MTDLHFPQKNSAINALRRRCIGLLAGLALAPALVAPALAGDPLAAATSEPLLTVIGEIAQTNAGASAQFDRDMLDALPQVSFETSTQWTDGINRFAGPSLKTVLERVGAKGGVIKAKAANDYVVEIPMDILSDDAPIVASSVNGEPLSLRTKGPLWIVFPYDKSEMYRRGEVYSYSIWQLVELNIAAR